MKIFKKILSVFFTVVIVLMIGILCVSIYTSGDNYGVPVLFNHSVLVVQTDSMEPTLMVGDGIIIEKVDTDDLKVQDIITYYRPSQGINITHRIVDIVRNDDESVKYFVCDGDNKDSEQCKTSVCATEAVYPKYVIGRYVSSSAFLGGTYTFLTNPVARVLLFVVPIGYLIIDGVFDAIKKGKEDQNEKEI